MKSIAEDLGVSVVTVSKVLHHHADISEKTRKRVLNRMKEVNYQPNLAARALSTGRTSLVGLIVPDLVHPFFAQVAKGITAHLSAHGYSLIISSSEEDAQLERKEIDQMMARSVDALILASTESDQESVRKLRARGMPFVLLDRKIPGVEANFVGIDDLLAGATATNHLIEIGCKRIAHIVGSDVSTAVDRQAGYEAALTKRGIPRRDDYVVKNGSGDNSGDAAGYGGMRRILELDPRPDGVFCCNDPIAMGAIRAVLEAGLRIPEDIAIIGCGNVHYDDLLRVPLTSIDQDAAGLGESAAKLALSIIKRKTKGSPKHVMLPSRLIVRASTQR
ncbi:MAG: LacI family DNA-binding transcriptional regulator [Candidatus Acidiferrales bacterium]